MEKQGDGRQSSHNTLDNTRAAVSKAVSRGAKGSAFATCQAHRLAVAAARSANFSIEIDPGIQHGVMDGTRLVRDMDTLSRQLENPLTAAGAPVEVHTSENYKIYQCLRNMPNCIKSMEVTRGDTGSSIGTNRPLDNTICVAIHHLDDKTYGGLCVLREWGAIDMAAVFVGYNPLQNTIWREMIDDIPDALFRACILQSTQPAHDAPGWAEGIYQIVRDFSKFPAGRSLPEDQFNRIFNGDDTTITPDGKPLTFFKAQRSLAAYNFLQAAARAHQAQKQVFVWEDGGYLNPIIDQAIHDNISVAMFRKIHMVPEDPETDSILGHNFANAIANVFIGTVELTRNGYDMSAAIAEERQMETRFFSIAASYEKVMLEGDSIAIACINAMTQVLYSTGYSLRDRNVLVIGARGNLGRLSVGHLVNILQTAGDQLWGCDLKLDWPSPVPGSIPEWAMWSACDVPLEGVAGEVAAYKDLDADVRCNLDVILGWTGGPRTVTEKDPVTGAVTRSDYQTITGQDVAEWLTMGEQKSRLYLVSGSTKTVEFSDVLKWIEDILNQPSDEREINGIALEDFIPGPIPDQLSIAAVTQMLPDQKDVPKQIKRNFGTQFTFKFRQNDSLVEKTIYLVNNTMPVNFMYYGTPTEIMDLTYSQVSSCAVALIENQNAPNGVYPTDYDRNATDHVYLGQHLDKDYPFPPSL